MGKRQETLSTRNGYLEKSKEDMRLGANELRSQHQDLYNFMFERGINLEDMWDAEGNLTNLFDDLGKVLSSESPEMWAEIQQLAQSMIPYKQKYMELDEEQISNQEEILSNQQDIWRNSLDITLQIGENILNVHDNIITALQKENDLLNRQMNRTSKYTEQQEISEDIIANDKKQRQALVDKRAEERSNLNALYSNPRYSSILNKFDVSRWVDENGEQTGYYLNDINDLKAIGSTEEYNVAVEFFEQLSLWTSSLSETSEAIEDTNDQIKSDIDKRYQQQVDAANTAIESVISMIEARKERELKALDQVHDKRVEQLQEESELIQDIYNKATNLLDDVKSEEDYQKQLSDEQKVADNLQQQIDQYALDDSDISAQKRIELQKQLNEQLEKIEDLKRNHEYEQTKKALNDDLDLYNEHMNELQEAEDKHYQYNKELIEGRYTQEKMYAEAYQILQEGIFTDFTAKGVYAYEQLYNKGNQVALDLTTAYDNFATETGDKFRELGVEFENMIGLFEKHSIVYDILNSDTPSWNVDTNATYADSSNTNWYGNTPKPTSNQKGSSALTDSSGHFANIQSKIEQMRNNSQSWFGKSESEQNRLHDENVKLSKEIGAVYNPSDGHYYLDGMPLYHTGKIANESKKAYELIDKTLKPNEERAIVLKNENVITTEKMQEWARGISVFANPIYHSVPSDVVKGLYNLNKTLATATTNYNEVSDNSTNIESITIGAGNNVTKADVRNGFKDLASTLHHN